MPPDAPRLRTPQRLRTLEHPAAPRLPEGDNAHNASDAFNPTDNRNRAGALTPGLPPGGTCIPWVAPLLLFLLPMTVPCHSPPDEQLAPVYDPQARRPKAASVFDTRGVA